MTLEGHPLLGMALFAAGGTSLVMAVVFFAAAAGPTGWALLGLATLVATGCLLGGKR
jgi:hypothetical protein